MKRLPLRVGRAKHVASDTTERRIINVVATFVGEFTREIFTSLRASNVSRRFCFYTLKIAHIAIFYPYTVVSYIPSLFYFFLFFFDRESLVLFGCASSRKLMEEVAQPGTAKVFEL